MLFLDSLRGLLCVRITCADVEALLTKLILNGIPIKNIDRQDELTVELWVHKCNYPSFEECVMSISGEVKVLSRLGLAWRLLHFRKRPVLISGILLYIFLTLFLPTRIFFVKVEGNQSVPDYEIINTAQSVGVGFGTSRRTVRSEKVKNALLSEMPQLQWVGVNTCGCVAIITVKERNVVDNSATSSGITSIIASRDGIVDSVIATKGNVLCKVGQAVRENQILISGYTDCGISIKATSAEGEIYAKTSRKINVILPLARTERVSVNSQEIKYSFIFGKKQINLYKDSGISDSSCVTMYDKRIITLPGGFALPVAVVKETIVYYDCRVDELPEDDACQIANNYALWYLNSQMVAGEVLTSSDSIIAENGKLNFCGTYLCREMIAKVYEEEIITGDEQRDRKNR